MRLVVFSVLLIGAGLVIFKTPEAVSSTPPPAPPAPLSVLESTSETAAVSAAAYGVFDVATGQLLFAHNETQRLPIASVTKLFTAAAALQTSEVDTITVTHQDVATEGRAGKLAAGEVYEQRELLFPLLLESSNDAAVALGRNLKALAAGDVSLADTSGLSAANQASVLELGAATQDVYRQFPHVFDITTLPQYIGEHTGWVNNSPVRDLPGYQGGKHGYTEAAGRTLVAVFTEPLLGDRELLYVLLRSEDLRTDTQMLREVVQHSVELQ